MTGTDPLLQWRKEFPILEKTTYLISHSLGAMPRRTAESLQQFAETWASRGIRAWEEGWWEMPVTVGNLVASIIGASPGEVVMHQNVSVCQAIVTSCFDWNGPRNKLITDGLNFPSNDYHYYRLERLGARVCRVASADGIALEPSRCWMRSTTRRSSSLFRMSRFAAHSCRIWPRSRNGLTKREHL